MAYVNMTRTELFAAPASGMQCVCSKISLSRLAILISSTPHRRLCIDMKSFVQETPVSLINNYLFADNAVAASLWKIRE